jgi:ribosomal protein S18 acetylase RimI-like enzyme
MPQRSSSPQNHTLTPGAMYFRRVRAAELAEVHALLSANGWTARIGSLQQFAELIEASQVAEVAVVDNRIVGFARGISDGRSNGYLSMIVVAAAHRRMGVGRRLVEHAIGTNPEVTWVLRAGREGAAEFFAKLGFEQSSLAMERRRSSQGGQLL